MSDLIILANLQHAKAATSCLIHDMLVTKGQVVALVQEPHLGGRGTLWGFPRPWGVITLLLKVNVGQLFLPKIVIFFFALNIQGGGTLLYVNFTRMGVGKFKNQKPKIRVRRKQADPWWSDDLSKQRRAVRQLQQ